MGISVLNRTVSVGNVLVGIRIAIDADPDLKRNSTGSRKIYDVFPVKYYPGIRAVSQRCNTHSATGPGVEISPIRCEHIVRTGRIGQELINKLVVFNVVATAYNSIAVAGKADAGKGLASIMER